VYGQISRSGEVQVAKPKPGIPKTLNHDSMLALLVAHGWTLEQGGKHVTKMTKPGHRPVTIPRHHGNDYGAQLRNAIITQAGIKREATGTDGGTTSVDKGEGR
jgi:predicted RNA binding protein YcfA (HicA-like mRNA interferase family)